MEPHGNNSRYNKLNCEKRHQKCGQPRILRHEFKLISEWSLVN